MKITKTGDRAALIKKYREKANAGCNVCPNCGEKESFLSYLNKRIYNKGLSSGCLSKTWATGFFKEKHMAIDCYKCNTCGCEWESEPYENV